MNGTQRGRKRVLRPRLPVNQARRRPIRKRAVPRHETRLIRVRGQSADGVNFGRDFDRLTPEPHVLRTVDETAAERSLRLKTDHDDVTLRPP